MAPRRLGEGSREPPEKILEKEAPPKEKRGEEGEETGERARRGQARGERERRREQKGRRGEGKGVHVLNNPVRFLCFSIDYAIWAPWEIIL